MEETVIRFVCLVATQDGALGWDGLREWYQWSGSAVGLQHAAWYTGRCAILDTERRGTHSVLCVTRPRISKARIIPTQFELRCELPSAEVVRAMVSASAYRQAARMAPRESSTKVMRDALRRK